MFFAARRGRPAGREETGVRTWRGLGTKILRHSDAQIVPPALRMNSHLGRRPKQAHRAGADPGKKRDPCHDDPTRSTWQRKV